MTATGTRPSWSISEAAERCGVSRSTVRRYREAGRFPSAFKDTAGGWMIPLPDLLAVGWKPNAPEPEPALSQPSEQPSSPALEERIRELEQALSSERAARESAESLAASFRQNAEDLRMALRMIEGPKLIAPEQPVEPALSSLAEQPRPAQFERPEQAQNAPEQPMTNTERDGRQPGPFLRRLLGRRL